MHLPYRVASSKFEILDRSLMAREVDVKSLRKNLSKAKKKKQQFASGKRRHKVFEIGDMVPIKLQPYRQTSKCR